MTSKRLTLEVCRDGYTGGIQVGLNELDEKGSGWGYRLLGPKFIGDSKLLASADLDQRDADEIRRHLDNVFPRKAADAEADNEHEAIHHFFGLSYCSHLVLPRVLLQSMPDEWQAQFVAVMREYDAAVHGIEQPEIYDVIPGREVEAGCLTEAERRATGVTVVQPDEDEDGEYVDPDAETKYYDKDSNEIEDWTRVVVPVADPLPPYNRGRTIIPEVRGNYQRAHSAQISGDEARDA